VRIDLPTNDQAIIISDLDTDAGAMLSVGPADHERPTGPQQDIRYFRRLIEAILFVVEEMPRERGREAVIQVRGRRLDWNQIKAEYHRRSDGI